MAVGLNAGYHAYYIGNYQAAVVFRLRKKKSLKSSPMMRNAL